MHHRQLVVVPVFILKTLAYKNREDAPGEFESTFLEIIIPNKKNIIVGCIYRHPSSSISIEDFSKEYLEPVLLHISRENKICSIVGGFIIDLLKVDTRDDYNTYLNVLSSNLFTPHIKQPIRPISKTLIDNIFLNSIEFSSCPGNNNSIS